MLRKRLLSNRLLATAESKIVILKQVCVEASSVGILPAFVSGACTTAPAAVDRYLLQTLALSSKPAGRRCCCRSMRQTDRRTNTRPFCPCFIFIFADFCQTNYLNIYRTNFHQICRVGRTMAADERSVVNVSISQGMLPWQPIFAGFICFYHRIGTRAIR